jgi:hypothetical protein
MFIICNSTFKIFPAGGLSQKVTFYWNRKSLIIKRLKTLGKKRPVDMKSTQLGISEDGGILRVN